MSGNVNLPMISAEFYEGALIGKEVVPNRVEFGKDFEKIAFVKSGLSAEDVFKVIADVYHEGERYIRIEYEADFHAATHADRFFVLEA